MIVSLEGSAGYHQGGKEYYKDKVELMFSVYLRTECHDVTSITIVSCIVNAL